MHQSLILNQSAFVESNEIHKTYVIFCDSNLINNLFKGNLKIAPNQAILLREIKIKGGRRGVIS